MKWTTTTTKSEEKPFLGFRSKHIRIRNGVHHLNVSRFFLLSELSLPKNKKDTPASRKKRSVLQLSCMNAAQRSKRQSRFRSIVQQLPHFHSFNLNVLNCTTWMLHFISTIGLLPPHTTVTTEMRSTISITTSATHYPSHHSEREMEPPQFNGHNPACVENCIEMQIFNSIDGLCWHFGIMHHLHSGSSTKNCFFPRYKKTMIHGPSTEQFVLAVQRQLLSFHENPFTIVHI